MYIKETNSTNDLIRLIGGKNNIRSVRTDFQTAGRGQTGNGWESERGKNLLCSVLRDGMQVRLEDAFGLTMKGAIAVWDTLREEVPDEEKLRIKWPNDVYYGDKKIAGILVESMVEGGKISSCVVGVGVNINQTEWQGDAPNPISLKMITGKESSVEEVYERFLLKIDSVWREKEAQTREAYLEHLYRKEGWWKFVEREVSVAPTAIVQGQAEGEFEAKIVGVERSGELVLERRNGEKKKYHFKQIRYVV